MNTDLNTHDADSRRLSSPPGDGRSREGRDLPTGPGHSPTEIGGARRGRRWLLWGAAVFAGDLVVHNTAARLANDWEGWGAEAGNVLFVAITGLLLVGLTFGVVVRRALRSPVRVGRIAGAALGTGIASLASFVIIFTWAPVLIAPAALLLAREALRSQPSTRAKRMALAGAGFGVATVAMFVWFLVVLFLTGSFPI